MNKVRTLLFSLLISYVIVMSVNFVGNYQYYTSGGDWRYSVYFCLAVTTLGWAGYVTLYELLFKKRINWTKRPMLSLLFTALISALYGVILMVTSMKVMVWMLGFHEQSNFEYVNNCIYSSLFSMLIGVIVTGQEFLKQWKKSTEDNERMKGEMLRSQFAVLKNQVNPHFLFNSLNTLAAIIPERPQVAVDFVQQMSKVFRYSLEYKEENTVALATELKVVSSYLFLNKQRFDGKLITDIKIEDEFMNRHIITQSLLMLVENAIKHNEVSNLNPLSIHIYNEGNMLVIKNTLQRKNVPEPSTNIGLANIRSRYQQVSDVAVSVTEEEGWFIVSLPLLSI